MSITKPQPPAAEPALYTVEETMGLLRMSRSVLYDQLRTGRLRSVKRGRRRLIPATAVREHVALLEQEAGGAR